MLTWRHQTPMKLLMEAVKLGECNHRHAPQLLFDSHKGVQVEIIQPLFPRDVGSPVSRNQECDKKRYDRG